MLRFLDPQYLIATFGYIGIFAIVFAESGLFFGFFLPGDSLLFTAGLLASQGWISFPILLVISFLGAVLGDNVGYLFGRKVGPKIFRREESVVFKKHHLEAARDFYEKHGSKTIVMARFVPFVRTFAPIVAGAVGMHYPTFMVYNLVGGLLWGAGVSTLGYFLGNIPVVRSHYELVIMVIIFASIVPVVMHLWKDLRFSKND